MVTQQMLFLIAFFLPMARCGLGHLIQTILIVCRSIGHFGLLKLLLESPLSGGHHFVVLQKKTIHSKLSIDSQF